MTFVWSAVPCLLMLAALLLLISARQQSEASVGLTLARSRRGRPRESLADWLQDYLMAAGIHVSARGIMLWGSLAVLAVVLLLMSLGSQLGALLILLALLLLNALLRLRAARLRRRIRAQLAPFMEQIMRDMEVGQNLEGSFRRAATRTPQPLKDVLLRVLARRDLGLDLDEGLEREARILRLYQFELLSTAVRIHQFHGGSMREILDSFVQLLRHEDRGRRELAALTGETRVSAWVLGLMPLGIGALMYYGDPSYFDPVLASTGGRIALLVALALEVIGGLWLWRMMRSI